MNTIIVVALLLGIASINAFSTRKSVSTAREHQLVCTHTRHIAIRPPHHFLPPVFRAVLSSSLVQSFVSVA
jgi:hypothetical protein